MVSGTRHFLCQCFEGSASLTASKLSTSVPQKNATAQPYLPTASQSSWSVCFILFCPECLTTMISGGGGLYLHLCFGNLSNATKKRPVPMMNQALEIKRRPIERNNRIRGCFVSPKDSSGRYRQYEAGYMAVSRYDLCLHCREQGTNRKSYKFSFLSPH